MKTAPAQPSLEIAPREMMREVSCRALGVILDAVESRGIPIEEWLGKVPVTEERLRDLNQWISWDAFVELLERLHERLPGGDAELIEIGYENFGTISFEFMRRIASFLLRPRDLYWMGTTWFGPTLFTVVEDQFEDLPHGEIRETLTVSSDRAGCRELFLIMEGAMRAAPSLLGRPDSHVKLELDESGRRAVYTVTPPPRASISATLRAVGRGLFGGRRFVEELSEQQTQLKLSHDRLWAVNRVVEEQEWRIRAVERMGRELTRHIELEPLTAAIFRMVGPLLPERGIALYVQPLTENQPRLLGHRGETLGIPSHTYPMEIGGAMVGRLQLWDAPADASDGPSSETSRAPGLPPGRPTTDDANTSLVEELVPWLAIALDNARAHETVREYSSALELRVKETTSERDEANGHLESERLERDYLLDRLRRTDEQLRLVEAMGSLNNLGVGIANQLIEPIDAIRQAVGVALSDRDRLVDHAEVTASLAQIERCAESAWGVVRGLSLFRHAEQLERQRTNVNKTVKLAVGVAEAYAREKDVRIEVTLSQAPCLVHVSRAQMEQVIVSLLRNGIEAAPRLGRISVKTENLEDGARITVADNGPGLDEPDLERVFELFYTTRRSEGHSGVGLCAARSIVTGDGGTLRAESDPESGTRFIIELPSEPPEPPTVDSDTDTDTDTDTTAETP